MFSRHIFAACNRYHPNFSWSDVDRSQFLQVKRTVCSQHLSNIGFRRFSSFRPGLHVFSSDSHVFSQGISPSFLSHFLLFGRAFRSAEHPTSEVRCQGAAVERGAAGCARRGLVSARHGLGAWHRGSVPGIVGRFSRRILDEKNGAGEYGNLWEPMGTYGNLWESMGFRCFVWMEIHESTRWTMVYGRYI